MLLIIKFLICILLKFKAPIVKHKINKTRKEIKLIVPYKLLYILYFNLNLIVDSIVLNKFFHLTINNKCI